MGSASVPRGWNPPDNVELEALIVGGGLAGLYALYKLRQTGIDAKIFEAGKELGGVWNYNRYPGARVDSEVPYYQYNIPEVWRTWNWSERFPGHKELRAYFHHTATVLRLYEHVAFSQNVTGCDFDGQRWVVRTEQGKTVRCKYLIAAGGSSYKTHLPKFDGIEKYRGSLFHAAAFPDENFDFRGKNVAVIGQGATGVQITQEVSKVASKLTIYVRTPNMALPMRQRKLSPEEQEVARSVYPHLFRLSRECRSGIPYYTDNKTLKDVTVEERDRRWEELWARGGFNFNLAGFRDFIFDQEANDLTYKFWRDKTLPRIKDPSKREMFVPEIPPHPIGTKRASLEQDYFECIDRPNVEAVNMSKTPIQEFDETGIVTADGTHRKFDVIILATGYDAITGSFTSMGLRDVNGVDMKQRWKEGVRTHLGMTSPGFPNLFMVYSPQAPTAFANGTTIIEAQGDWVASTIAKMKDEGVEVIEARTDAAEKWAGDIQEMNSKTLFPLTNSWYMGANIPGKKREQLNYLAGIQVYEQACKDAQENWSGFSVSTSVQRTAKV